MKVLVKRNPEEEAAKYFVGKTFRCSECFSDNEIESLVDIGSTSFKKSSLPRITAFCANCKEKNVVFPELDASSIVVKGLMMFWRNVYGLDE